MSLTATAVAALKGRDKPYKIADSGGLHLLVMPEGHRYWRMNYRFDGKYRTLALGVYPDVSLAKAREKRDLAREALEAGEDPTVRRKRLHRVERLHASHTFKTIAEEWLAKVEAEGRSESTMHKLRWILAFTYPLIGERPVREIEAVELLEVLRKIEARGRHETARRLRSTCGAVFRYAIATGRATRDISADLRGALIAPKVTHRAAILEPKAAGELLRAIDSFSGQPSIHAALRLAPHVFVRPGELRHAEWTEVDGEEAVWTIPAEKTKMRRPHRVPLSRQALEIMEELWELTGDGKYLFPCIRTNKRPMSENTVNAALRRLGYDKTEMTGHGFRAMASTMLNEMGKWHPDAIERQLGHVENDDVRRAYARGEHWRERVAMMQYWSDYLDKLRTGGKIVIGKFGRSRTVGA